MWKPKALLSVTQNRLKKHRDWMAREEDKIPDSSKPGNGPES
ncbi:MAG TPA: hypothetical protein VN414_06895 [Methanosarcina sp.]|nr:hypothetical protein [Methanosarcina sp.]